jgi:sugar lactone lactonase YvrE
VEILSLFRISSRTQFMRQAQRLFVFGILLLPVFATAQSSSTGVEATTITTSGPAGVAYDAAGILYVALRDQHVVVRVDGKGLITTIVGTGEQGFGGDGGAAASAILDSPSGLAVDGSGNLYIADSHNNRIREVVNGVIATIAGTGASGFGGDTGLATQALLSRPAALSVDANGNLLIADADNHRIRMLSKGIITTVAGDGEQTFSGDGGAATAAGLDTPNGVAADPSTPGRFYISDTRNQRVRVVDPTGTISTIAGNGVKGLGGSGSPATASSLARPRGLAVSSAGAVYFADSDNNLVRTLQGTTLASLTGDGEQGFAGDTATAASAVLDTPTAVALSSGGVITLSDTHNQRTRSLVSGLINTVAGVPPAQTEGIFLSGPVSTTFGVGTLVASFSNGSKIATGAATLLDGTAQAGSAAFVGNQTSFSLSNLHAGFHVLAVTYPGDQQNAPSASGQFLLTIAQAQQTIDFPLNPLTYSVGTTIALTASASSGLPVTYSVAGPATLSGSMLTFTGPGTVEVTAQAGDQDYVTVMVTRTITVTPPALTGISPSAAPLGSPSLLLTVTGTSFIQNSTILINGSPVPTMFVNASTLTTVLSSATFTTVQTLLVSVSSAGLTTGALPFTVAAPPVNVSASAPSTTNPGTQPGVTLTLANPYPVPVSATFTLTFTPGASGVDDPAIVFTNGKRSVTVNVPAGSTTIPEVQLQAGTVAGTIQVAVVLTAGGVNVTPASLVPSLITVPPAAPGQTQVTVTRSGNNLTVSVIGYSDTRDMTQAIYHFAPVPGATIQTQDVTVNVASAFAGWYSQAASNAYGSEFLYTQTFTVNEGASIVGQVTVTLVNSVGSSAPGTAQ